ncbi:hypothetical protein LTS08_006377 [Lithohypha guttulata]|nr:hypothetical protein LTS08_006377 [Lithohypha guttulata]
MPPTPTPYQGYQPHFQPMMYNGPQFATFDAGNKRSAPIHEDSLPAMPSWDNAQTRRVQDTPSQPRGSEVEMEHMLPQSPIREYHNSDLGTQRPNRPEGLNNNYYNNEPLSPAPTYATTAPMAGAFSNQQHDRFSPRLQHHDNPFDTGIPSNNAPYPSSRESVQFAAQRSMSPHMAPYNPYNSPSYDQPQAGRPPTLLQVGRKPVAGSYREV